MESNLGIKKILSVLNHIKNVQENCYKLGIKLIDEDQFELGRNLIANGQIHDNSKFKGIEFDHLFEGSALLQDVVKHHNTTNPHHPEYWGSIQQMPDVFIAEMVCDCTSRASEFGNDIRVWFETKATVKYGFTFDEGDRVGQRIKYFLGLLLTPVWSHIVK